MHYLLAIIIVRSCQAVNDKLDKLVAVCGTCVDRAAFLSECSCPRAAIHYMHAGIGALSLAVVLAAVARVVTTCLRRLKCTDVVVHASLAGGRS